MLCAKVTKELMELCEKGTHTEALDDIVRPASFHPVNFDDLETVLSQDGPGKVVPFCQQLELL